MVSLVALYFTVIYVWGCVTNMSGMMTVVTGKKDLEPLMRK